MIPKTLGKLGLKTAYGYIEKDPEHNLPKLMEWVDRLAGDGPNSFLVQRDAFRTVINDPDNNMHQLLMNIFREVDNDVLKATFENFLLNANIVGWPIQEDMRSKYNCNIPWAILLDPTSACNLHCTGCWAAEYGNKLNLSLNEIDSIIQQGKELGVYMYIYTGGEPMVRSKDIIALCQKHSDCQFLAFTNATLIDEAFADDMLRVKNFIPAISLEGFEMATDGRRGNGVYQKVLRTMSILRQKRLPFIDQLVKWGAQFIWYFHYMPVGNDAVPTLMPNPQQRKAMYYRIREIRSTKPLFAMDFQNDGEYVGGCIAGGRRYLHINANGDVDPCVFVHYSDSNIREKSLLDCLRSPMFMAYHDGQPFNDNHLLPCPMLENPEKLREMVHRTGAHSTDLQSPESVDHLCDKCVSYAQCWKPEAERLWGASHAEKQEKRD